jgi:hypothetical protein
MHDMNNVDATLPLLRRLPNWFKVVFASEMNNPPFHRRKCVHVGGSFINVVFYKTFFPCSQQLQDNGFIVTISKDNVGILVSSIVGYCVLLTSNGPPRDTQPIG